MSRNGTEFFSVGAARLQTLMKQNNPICGAKWLTPSSLSRFRFTKLLTTPLFMLNF